MKAQLSALSATGLLLAAGVAQAAGRDVQTYLDRASAAATAKLADAGVSLPAQRVDVRATVGGDGRLNGLRVVRSSGSLEADRKASEVLRRLKVSNPPVSLVGADVTVAVGDERLVAAGAP